MSTPITVGSRRPRLDADAKVRGQTRYTADIALEGALAGAVARSPHAFARVVRVDVTRAAAMPGVRAIVYAGNTPPQPLDFGIKDQHLFPRPYARYAGEPVAAVAADSEAQARAAAAAIDVEYEVLEPVLDAQRALEAASPLVHPDWKSYEKLPTRVLRGNVCGYNRIRRGDVAAAFERSDVVVHASEFRFSPGLPGYIEPRAAAARRETDGGLTVWCGSQSPYDNRDELAKFFGLAPERVRFINQFVGGAFGGKIIMAPEWYAAALALQCDRPVRMAWSRHEDGLHAFPRHGGTASFRSAATADGRLVAMRASFIYDTGAYIGYGTGTALISTMLASAPYRIPDLDLEATLVYTNKHVAGPVRAPGGPQANYAKELHLDELAALLGLDPLEFRLRNAWEDGDRGPGGQKLSGVRVKEALRKAADAVGWGTPARPGSGRGIACTWWFSSCGESKARVEVRADGTILLASGNPEVGTGASSTALPMMAAEVLGVDPARITVVLSDTATDTYDSGVGGSSSTFGAGMAVAAAAGDARTKLLALAEDALEARTEDIELRDGRALVRGSPDHSVPLADLARKAGGSVTGLGESAEQDDPEFDESLTETHGFASWLAPSYTASAAHVDVDRATGAVIVRKLATAQDVGYAVNPVGAIGQIEGGAVMGVGWALTEALAFDERGHVKPDLKDYLMPTAVDAPEIETILIESSPGVGPYGLKGVGEPPITTPPAAIACAIRAAVGAAPHETPMTPERVWRAARQE
ncbi:MAG TPA: xanthine dehydrogenase family protein molybdopterin-binding subunit [Candidatus Eremiobacteraceae bacterium]|nr:xanthine dehydrogenase family protein molybdopterin-binding subunit [Candidatus Eremiobacteraceae bacterium]